MAKAATTSAVTSSGEMTFQAMFLPVGLLPGARFAMFSTAQRVPPVFSQRYWSTLPVKVVSFSR